MRVYVYIFTDYIFICWHALILFSRKNGNRHRLRAGYTCSVCTMYMALVWVLPASQPASQPWLQYSVKIAWNLQTALIAFIILQDIWFHICWSVFCTATTNITISTTNHMAGFIHIVMTILISIYSCSGCQRWNCSIFCVCCCVRVVCTHFYCRHELFCIADFDYQCAEKGFRIIHWCDCIKLSCILIWARCFLTQNPCRAI